MQNGENLFRLSIVNGTSHLLRSNLYWLGFLDKFGATISKMFEAIWKEAMEEPGKKSAVPLYCQGTLRMHTLVRLIGKYHYVYCCMHTLVVKIRMH